MAEQLVNLSETMASVVENGGVSVVRVEGRRRLPASGIVWSADGLVVTAHHVVKRDENLHLGLPNGERVGATLLGRDPSTDLALLRAEASDLTAVNWTEPDELQVGHLVLALGRPGSGVQATLGIVSALGAEWRTPAGGNVDHYLQTDVVMYPGFSGGPTVDAAGKVLGLNTSALMRGTSLSIPTPTVRRVVETLLTHGRVRRGFLGVGIQPVRLPKELAQQLEQETGLLLVSVDPDGAGGQGGLLMGDTIVALDGQAIRHMDDLQRQLSGDRVGQGVPVRVVRGGVLKELQLVVGERP